ncbi:thioesterase [Salinispora arenicola]|uniref:Thioesterase n=1 Tax=Salinispora arenicola TaxID=168697 RepID=A0A542XNU8_SALAC|nr:alpha/beta fold hydrolase [Salinispora arenicola]NIL43206.1 thioesterase [Salinispora arenicola]TQL37538.1 surfactin synthase thioesterase subunit [Salinispora arenicola]GIM87129.1 thioesterase [Salinispora arenicola]
MRCAADHERTTLYCLPYAGGSARVYAGWARELPDWIEVRPLELPGRGLRFDEPPHTAMEPLVAELRDTVCAAPPLPFAVFGHSLGGMLGYELVRRLQEHDRPAERLFVAGAGAPHLPRRKPAHHLDVAGFRAHLAELGGTPPEILANDELMDLLLPVLRADFTLADTYQGLPGPDLACPLVAAAGERDPDAPPADVAAWRRYAPRGFAFHVLPGDHFFLDSARAELLGLIVAALCPGCATAAPASTNRKVATS